MIKIRVHKTDQDVLMVTFPYSEEIIKKIKQINGKRWVPAKKYWTIPNTDKSIQHEFLDFMKQVRKKYRGKKLTIIMDNLQSHKTPAVKKWLDGQKGMVEFIFMPKHASWLNQIEVWFKELNQKCIRRSSVTSKEEMSENILNWIMTYNKHYAHPYNWLFNGILKKHEEKAA